MSFESLNISLSLRDEKCSLNIFKHSAFHFYEIKILTIRRTFRSFISQYWNFYYGKFLNRNFKSLTVNYIKKQRWSSSDLSSQFHQKFVIFLFSTLLSLINSKKKRIYFNFWILDWSLFFTTNDYWSQILRIPSSLASETPPHLLFL